MRATAIVAAAIVGGFFGMIAGTAIALGFGAGDGVSEAATVVGFLGGAVGLGVLVARLVPTKRSRLRERGTQRMQRR